MGSLRSLQGKNLPDRRFFGDLSAKRDKLLVIRATSLTLQRIQARHTAISFWFSQTTTLTNIRQLSNR
jgi:hypothetical protein